MRLFLCFSNIVSIIKSRVLCEFQSETLSVTHPSFKSLDEGRRAQEEGDKTLELMPELPCNDAFFERRSWESGVCSFMFFSLRGLRKKAIKWQCLNIILNSLTFQLIWISAPKLYRCNLANFSAWKKFKSTFLTILKHCKNGFKNWTSRIFVVSLSDVFGLEL